MDVYDYAMQMERDGEDYYREMARNCQIDGLKTILTMLANEEVKHYNIIKQLQQREEISQVAPTAILENVKNIFSRMKEEKVAIVTASSQVELYKKALDIEEQSMQFYRGKASVEQDATVKQIFMRLADEEEKHFRIMDNIVEFVGRPEPGNWLENAEWHHLDNY